MLFLFDFKNAPKMEGTLKTTGEVTSDTGREKEKCVICDDETEYYKDTNIDLRKHYIEGCGQLCPKCYRVCNG